MAFRTSSEATDMSFLKSNCSWICAWPSEAVERSSCTCEMLCRDFSTRLMISRSTVSGDAPGYGMFTTIIGSSTSGRSLTRSFLNAISPTHISTMTIATVVTGCLMLKLERNMARPVCRERGLLAAGRERNGFRHLHGLAVLQRGGRILEDGVALGNATGQHELAAARVAI